MNIYIYIYIHTCINIYLWPSRRCAILRRARRAHRARGARGARGARRARRARRAQVFRSPIMAILVPIAKSPSLNGIAVMRSRAF